MALDWLWWRAWFPVDAVDAAALRVAGVALGDGAGVALGDMDVHSAWQARHLATWTCILRGRRGTYGTGLALVARLVLSGRRGRRGCWRGRRGAWRHRLPLCVAGVVLGDIDLHFVWQAWHLWTGGALGSQLTPLSPRLLAGVALGDLDLHFAWQAWHGTGLAHVAEAAIDTDCRARNSCFASSPTRHESLHRFVVHACCCCLTCLTCQVPLRSSFANLLHSPCAHHRCYRPYIARN